MSVLIYVYVDVVGNNAEITDKNKVKINFTQWSSSSVIIISSSKSLLYIVLVTKLYWILILQCIRI